MGGGQLSALGGRSDRREDFASKELLEYGHREKEIRSVPDPPVAVNGESAVGHPSGV
jgi:hypothetical protein